MVENHGIPVHLRAITEMINFIPIFRVIHVTDINKTIKLTGRLRSLTKHTTFMTGPNILAEKEVG